MALYGWNSSHRDGARLNLAPELWPHKPTIQPQTKPVLLGIPRNVVPSLSNPYTSFTSLLSGGRGFKSRLSQKFFTWKFIRKINCKFFPLNRPVSFNLIQLLNFFPTFALSKWDQKTSFILSHRLVKYTDELLSNAIFPLSLPDSYPIFRPLRTCWDHGTSFNFLPSTPSLIAWRHCLE